MDATALRSVPRFVLRLCAVVAFAWAGAVGAEEQGDDEARDEPEEEAREPEEVVVTGTRLRDVISGVPIVVINREDMLLQGLGSVEDLVRSLPQNFSDVNAAATLDNSMNSVDTIGQSAVDLRNLGEGSTLVLVNGRRWVQSSTFGNGAVNLNGIPFNAIERVEVLTDGASAIYGADAQAGVINFILRDDFSGAETSLRQDLGANEGDILKIEQTAGVSWAGGALLRIAGQDPQQVGFGQAAADEFWNMIEQQRGRVLVDDELVVSRLQHFEREFALSSC